MRYGTSLAIINYALKIAWVGSYEISREREYYYCFIEPKGMVSLINL